MKKLLALLCAFCLTCGSLVACGSQPAPSVEEPTLRDGYIAADYALLNSPASENGMKDTKIYFHGKAVDLLVAGDTADYYYALVETDDGQWLVLLGGGDNYDADKIAAAYATMEKVAGDYYVQYQGFSGLFELPSSALGSGDTITCGGTTFQFVDFLTDAVLNGEEPAEEEVDDTPLLVALHAQELLDMNSAFDFAGIVELIDQFIEQHSPDEDDFAYELRAAAVEGVELLANCKLEHDSFANTTYIYYSGVEEISSSVNFVPYFLGSTPRVKIGFRKSDWLFFDKIDIKVGEGTAYQDYVTYRPDYFDIVHDVYRGGISEIIDFILPIADAQKIANAEIDPIIRFSNTDELTNYDHDFTQGEIEAIQTLVALYNSKTYISQSIKEWEA